MSEGARSRKCSCTGCDERGDRWITPMPIEGLPDPGPVLMCKRHADMAEAALARRADTIELHRQFGRRSEIREQAIDELIAESEEHG